MNNSYPLQRLLFDFFNLPPETSPSQITQRSYEGGGLTAKGKANPDWQGAFTIECDLNKIEMLRS